MKLDHFTFCPLSYYFFFSLLEEPEKNHLSSSFKQFKKIYEHTWWREWFVSQPIIIYWLETDTLHTHLYQPLKQSPHPINFQQLKLTAESCKDFRFNLSTYSITIQSQWKNMCAYYINHNKSSSKFSFTKKVRIMGKNW